MPILRWKQAEQKALKDLSKEQKDRILPMIVLLYPAGNKELRNGKIKPNWDEITVKVPQEILKNWGDGRKFFIDFNNIVGVTEERLKIVEELIHNALQLKLSPILVVDLCDCEVFVNGVFDVATKNTLGLCLRFKEADITKIADEIDGFKEAYHVSDWGRVSIMMDLMQNLDQEVFQEALEEMMALEQYDLFDNIVIASGAFPVDMSRITSEKNLVPRLDWQNWDAFRHKYNSKRYPFFADYTIRYPAIQSEQCKFTPTATIKYTLLNAWRIFKGEVGKFEQCLAAANVFIDDEEFRGEDFSAGDRYIAEKGRYFEEYENEKMRLLDKGKKGTGNAGTWLYAGINHHIVTVLDQISNLDD